MTDAKDLSDALYGTGFHSGETFTDALFAIAEALHEVARRIEATGYPPLAGETLDGLVEAVGNIAEVMANGQGE